MPRDIFRKLRAIKIFKIGDYDIQRAKGEKKRAINNRALSFEEPVYTGGFAITSHSTRMTTFSNHSKLEERKKLP